MPTSPPVTFTTFVVSLAHSTLHHSGDAPLSPADIEMGRHTLELLDMLATKTVNNLDAEEHRLLETVRAELRTHFG